MNIGLFGGTFDPPHVGHLIVAQDAVQVLSLDRLWFVPAAEPPHKRGRAITPANIRLEMLHAAIRGEPRFEVCALELQRGGPSYTVDTLRQLHAAGTTANLHLLVGADQARDLASWREPQEIARLARIIVLSREGVETLTQQPLLQVREIRVTRIDVSASDIRERVARGRPIRYLVPAAVEDIIQSRHLYRVNVPNGDAQAGVAS
ncbi:MAG: nicotinate-nucleotide adenylyltransferase [Longimicrobiales bacterium]